MKTQKDMKKTGIEIYREITGEKTIYEEGDSKTFVFWPVSGDVGTLEDMKAEYLGYLERGDDCTCELDLEEGCRACEGNPASFYEWSGGIVEAVRNIEGEDGYEEDSGEWREV